MTDLKFIISLLAIFFLTSCRETNRLSEKDHKWIPYKGDETLVFSSSAGNIDTIFFIKKDTLIAYPKAQSLKGSTYETVRIFCRHSDATSRSGSYRYLGNDFVELK